MKKFILLGCFVLFFTTAATAADKAGDPCPISGGISQTGFAGADVLSCIDGKWEKIGQIGTTMLSISVQLMEGDKKIFSTQTTMLDGQPTPLMVGVEHAYAALTTKDANGKLISAPGKLTTGLNMLLTPTLTDDGRIAVKFTFNKSELTSTQTLKLDDGEIELPQVNTITLSQKVTIKSGEEIIIPFGVLIKPKMLGPVHTQYTVKLSATKQASPPAR